MLRAKLYRHPDQASAKGCSVTLDTLTIDDFTPVPIQRPSSVTEVCELVKATRAAKQGVYPVGGRTTLDLGLPPTKHGIALDTTRLNQIIDYPARDMTVTVQAGITFGALQEELAKEGQWLPIDVPGPEHATIGGVIASNQSGPHRYGYGTLRDYVIGISFVSDDGVEVKAGGRVVKNVAGYDLMKLQTGALGTLGIITQVTLKVKPRPEASAAVRFSCSDELLAKVLDLLHSSITRPVVVELLNSEAYRATNVPFASSNHDWIVVVGFEEKATTVRWQLNTLHDELRTVAVRDIEEVSAPATLWSKFTQLQLRTESTFINKLSVLPSQLAAEVRQWKHLIVHAHALNGIIWLHGERPLENAVIRRCPVDRKRSLSIWGRPNPAWDLMRKIKRTLDPDDVFNPGRLFNDL